MNNMKLPVGIDQFDKLIKSGFYYVDKTRLIEQLLQNWGEVNLFTRPRRFGKTLNIGAGSRRLTEAFFCEICNLRKFLPEFLQQL